MTGILMTPVSTPIIGQVAWLLGKILDGVYHVLNGVFGIQNIGVCIILLTVIIYMLLLPLTIKQQKFSKMSAAMNPEIQKIQKKYQGKRDQASMQKMQEETQMVYDKYGISPTGGCLSMFIQLPILYTMWYVIRNIPAYVSQVKAVYMPLVDAIQGSNGWQKIMEAIGEAQPVLMDPSKYDYTKANTIIDVLYKFQESTWNTLIDKFPALESTIESTMHQLQKMNSFLGLNIAEAPLTMIKSGFKSGAYGMMIVALLIPILAGLTQYISVKMVPQNPGQEQNNQMASTMKTMNIMFPLMSVFMSFTLPTGLGIYWITSAVVRTAQMFFINRSLSKMPMEELIQANMEKAEKKRKNKKEIDAATVNAMAQKKVKNIKEPRSAAEEKALEEKLEAARRRSEGAKEGSLTSKANMVKRFNEGNKK